MRLKIELELDDQDCDVERWTGLELDIKEILEQLREMNETGEVEDASVSDPELH